MSKVIYKIMQDSEWGAFGATGVFAGSSVDIADGYIHFSTAQQVQETAAKHFAHCDALRLVGVDSTRLPSAALKWEGARGGALFPHLYDVLCLDAVVESWALPWVSKGHHQFPSVILKGDGRDD